MTGVMRSTLDSTSCSKKKDYELAATSAAIRGANIAFRNQSVEETMRSKIKAMGQQLTGEETDMRVFCARD